MVRVGERLGVVLVAPRAAIDLQDLPVTSAGDGVGAVARRAGRRLLADLSRLDRHPQGPAVGVLEPRRCFRLVARPARPRLLHWTQLGALHDRPPRLVGIVAAVARRLARVGRAIGQALRLVAGGALLHHRRHARSAGQ